MSLPEVGLLRAFPTFRTTYKTAPFRFVDPGPLIDGELELVAPAERWIEPTLATCHHPQTRRESPGEGTRTRDELMQFVRAFPGGHQNADDHRGVVPAYYLWMRLHPGSGAEVPIAGTIGLRIGHTRDLEQYMGHIGYGVFPPARGHHYAERATRLLFPLAREHGLNPLWITCNPDNLASRRTCERLGGRLVDIVDLPENHSLTLRGEHHKCRYRVDL